jgi:hypothetical protein
LGPPPHAVRQKSAGISARRDRIECRRGESNATDG